MATNHPHGGVSGVHDRAVAAASTKRRSDRPLKLQIGGAATTPVARDSIHPRLSFGII
jgi:hypothetical protein